DDLVDRVVDDLVDEMMEAARVDAADVHARALADGFEPFQDGDVPRGVGGGRNPAVVKRVPFPDAGHDLRPGSTARAAAYSRPLERRRRRHRLHYRLRNLPLTGLHAGATPTP